MFLSTVYKSPSFVSDVSPVRRLAKRCETSHWRSVFFTSADRGFSIASIRFRFCFATTFIFAIALVATLPAHFSVSLKASILLRSWNLLHVHQSHPRWTSTSGASVQSKCNCSAAWLRALGRKAELIGVLCEEEGL